MDSKLTVKEALSVMCQTKEGLRVLRHLYKVCSEDTAGYSGDSHTYIYRAGQRQMYNDTIRGYLKKEDKAKVECGMPL